MTKVSVIIPAYNAAQFVELAARSAVSQTHPDMEVVVIDDGSKDATASIAESIPGVTCIRKPNGGVSSARNVGLRACSGELIAFLDADDIWHPQKIAAQVALMERYPDSDLGYTRIVFKTEQFDPQAKIAFDPVPAHTLVDELEPTFRRPYLGTSSVMVRRRAVERVGGFDESLPFAEDIKFFLQVVVKQPQVTILEFPAVYKRPVAGSLSEDSSAGYEKVLNVYRELIERDPDLAAKHPALIATTIAEHHLRHGRSELRCNRRSSALASYLRAFSVRPSAAACLGVAKACTPPAITQAMRGLKKRRAT
jgi:glycosyltransferase involved in cell wall biosynthesis